MTTSPSTVGPEASLDTGAFADVPFELARPARSRRRWYALSLVLAVSLATLAFLRVDLGTREVFTQPTARVGRERIERIVLATGTIKPKEELEIRSRVSGVVEKIFVAEGQRVREGDTLMTIERTDLSIALREAESQLRAYQVELRYAEQSMRRAETLLERGVLAATEIETATRAVESAEARVALGEAARDAVALSLDRAVVRAPMDGTVLGVHVDPLDQVSEIAPHVTGTPLLTLADTSVLILEALVDENSLSQIRAGQLSRVRTETFGERVFEGRVQKIALIGERIEGVTYFAVEIAIPGEGATALRSRMSADAEIVAEVVEDAIVVPDSALRYVGEDVFVDQVIRSDSVQIRRRAVEIGIVQNGRVQIVEGLEAGAELVL